jgi:hypothetical protein
MLDLQLHLQRALLVVWAMTLAMLLPCRTAPYMFWNATTDSIGASYRPMSYVSSRMEPLSVELQTCFKVSDRVEISVRKGRFPTSEGWRANLRGAKSACFTNRQAVFFFFCRARAAFHLRSDGLSATGTVSSPRPPPLRLTAINKHVGRWCLCHPRA